MKVSKEKVNAMLADMNIDPNREIGVALSVGHHTIKKVHTDPLPYDINGKQGLWYPVEFEDGARVSAKTVLRSRGLQWSSRKLGDRLVALVENGEGKDVELLDVHSEKFTDNAGNSFDGKVYTYAPTLIG